MIISTTERNKMMNMKRVVAEVALVFSLTFSLYADTETINGYTWTYRIKGDAAEIFKGEESYGTYYNCTTAISPKPTGSVTIPLQLGGKPVNSIGLLAFSHCSGLTSVTIPDSVTSIGSSAFYGCSGLTSVTIPASVTNIASNAFSGCNKVQDYVVDPVNPVFNSTNGFLLTDGGTSILFCPEGRAENIIPDSVTSIGSSTFYNCSGLTSVTISNSVTSIGDRAFYGCSGLTHVTMPNSITNIGYSAFSNCNKIRDVTIPHYVCTNTISKVFPSYQSITNVVLCDNVTEIGNNAFNGCSKLISVTIPEGVKSIGYYAFSGCGALANITIPNSVMSIGQGAFSGCNDTLFDSSTIDSYASFKLVDGWIVGLSGTLFARRIKIENIRGIADYSFKECRMTDVTISDDIKAIGAGTFYNCRGLTSVTIPDSVTSIGSYAFSGCSGLTSVTIPDSVTSTPGQYPWNSIAAL